MKQFKWELIVVLLFLLTNCSSRRNNSSYINLSERFNNDWEFVKDIGQEIDSSMFLKENKLEWENITLPHTAQIEPLIIKGEQWQGICFYRKFFTIKNEFKDKHIAIQFEGAMQLAKVYLNGRLLKTKMGGYLPFYVDITNYLEYGKENCILVALDNNDNPLVPPGKALNVLDFNIYSGIYRNVNLIIKDKLRISNSIDANKIAGGGIFVTYENVSEQKATIKIAVDVKNDKSQEQNVQVEVVLKDGNGKIVLNDNSEQKIVLGNSSNVFDLTLKLEAPQLWSPNSPNLYSLTVNTLLDGTITDSEELSIGIRSFSFSAKEGFVLNGKPIKLRGTNRHQEYPYMGYAISDNANYRDAYKIKQAGFNFVRLSHYPQSKSFLTACDELGILAMDAIPGWQYFGDSVFQKNAFNDIRKMIRWDRNHPSIVVWEASLNESDMSIDFMQKAHNIVHQEYPGNNAYSSGWMDTIFDIFIPARQHAKPPLYWNNYDKEKPFIIAEYGDWEYYAQNAGFNQKEYKNLSEEERNSRQLRGFGQKRLLQQALNYQEAHNDNLKGKMVGDANWLMFDYNRGYAPDIEASGIMDIFRLPKFAFYFFQSQADILSENKFNQPMVAIANFYNDPSMLDIKVYSNCHEIELFVNGQSVGKQLPDTGTNSTHLNHPPFTFQLKEFVPGEIKAVAYKDGKVVAKAVQQTPGKPSAIKVWMDESGRALEKNCNDVVFLYAAVIDKNGTIIPEATNSIIFKVEGDGSLIGNNPINAEAGIASILLKAGENGGQVKITARAKQLKTGTMKLSIP